MIWVGQQTRVGRSRATKHFFFLGLIVIGNVSTPCGYVLVHKAMLTALWTFNMCEKERSKFQ